MATMAQSAVQAFPSPLFPHPGLSSSTAAALAPGGISLKALVLELQMICCAFKTPFCFPSPSMKNLPLVKVWGFPDRCHRQTQAFMSHYRHVSFCWIVPSSLPENYPPHVARSSPAQPHSEPRQLHGAHHGIGAGRASHPEGDCGGDHLFLYGQHAGPDGGDGMCCSLHSVRTTAPAAHLNTRFHFSV